jgi:translation initiation factor 2 subunit 3
MEGKGGLMEKAPVQAALNIGLVGHVDHGKTMLTKALTGIMTDTHSEELKRGISIRLGYADAVFRKCDKCQGSEAYTIKEKCPVCGKKTKVLRRVSFIDAPGHETLMTTVLSGAALMQGAILVIAANEKCPQPSTSEHLMALELSGIKDLVVVQNKIDLVDKAKALESRKEIQAFLKEHGFENVPIVPLAANFGTNVDLLIETIEKNIPTPQYDLKKPVKMFVARSFDINKPGISPEELKGGVIGGSIQHGQVKIGDEIEIKPGFGGQSFKTKVKSLSTAAGALKQAEPGGLIAIGTSLDPGLTRNDQMRGQTAGAVGSLPEPVEKLELKVHMLKRLLTKVPKLKVNENVILAVGTSTALGVVAKEKGENVAVNLKVPVVIDKGQKVAVSTRMETGWRLVAYGVNQ